MEGTKEKLLEVTPLRKYQTVDELIKQGTPNEMFYAMLVLSSIIIAAGVILGNIPIVIGGMLVTPLLTQILLLSLGFVVGEKGLIKDTSIFIGKVTLAIVVGSLFLGLIFGQGLPGVNIVDSLSVAFLYFVVAAASGIAVTLAWIRKEVSEVLPGIAIAVSLVPPLAYIGVGMAHGEFELAVFYFVVYIINLIGVVMGSLIVFSLSKFNSTERVVSEKIKETKNEVLNNNINQ